MQPNPLSADQLRQILAFLLLGAKCHRWNYRGPHVGIQRKQKPIVLAAVAQSFQRTNRGQSIRPSAAVLSRNRKTLNPKLCAFFPELKGEFFFSIAPLQVVVQLLLQNE